MDLSLAFQVQRKKSALGGADRGKDARPSLEGCLASYTAEEQLAANDYSCNECSAKGATKQLKLKELPVILCMQLKVSSHVPFRSPLRFETNTFSSGSKLAARCPRR
jgi:ubiquitin carboxyl-terminal hydrolase 22/27/51